AQFGVDGDELHQLYRRADEACAQAKAIGGDRVLPAGWSPGAHDGLTDVIIVEDDPVLASLLTHALDTRGHRNIVISDGREAVRVLTGPSRRRARVILLDVDLPGMSGLDVLSRLSRDGVLSTARVIMLTARSGEPEVLAALQQGAYDHVAKPFSVPVLMQRVRGAMAG
ncbi:MAG TPA: response regulator transcription factor, partial [Nocardioides sp.]|nr:response regulator transcription factor [Nocardioides sp.]